MGPALLCRLLAFGLQGCTTLLPIELSDPQNVAAQIVPGARVRVLTADGAREDLLVTAVGPDSLDAKGCDGSDVHIRLADVQRLDRRVRAPGKTAALVGGLAALYIVTVLTVATSAIVAGF
jgi:hypothetical protein